MQNNCSKCYKKLEIYNEIIVNEKNEYLFITYPHDNCYYINHTIYLNTFKASELLFLYDKILY